VRAFRRDLEPENTTQAAINRSRQVEETAIATMRRGPEKGASLMSPPSSFEF
jgi:hypothetical protein